MLTAVETSIGLADSEIVSVGRVGGVVTINIRAWDASMVLIRFSDVVLIRDYAARDIGSLQRYLGDSELLGEALLYHYDVIPRPNPFVHFSFLDLAGNSCLEVIAEKLDVEYQSVRSE